MPDDSPPRPLAEPITVAIAERVRALREAAGWTQAQLADAVAEHGLPWKRATVVNLEKRAATGRDSGGGRDSISVQELLVLALVFNLPFPMLIADPRKARSVPIAPGAEIDPWVALSWLVGDTPLIREPQLDNWRRESWLIWAGHDVSTAIGELEKLERAPDEGAFASRNEERHRRALESLRTALIRIDAAGAQAPPLPDHVLLRAQELDVDLGVAGR